MHERYPDNLEALQYLEGLCRDLGRSSDEFTQRLDRLRRALGVQAGAMLTQGASLTRSVPVDTIDRSNGSSVDKSRRYQHTDDVDEMKYDQPSIVTAHRPPPERSARPGRDSAANTANPTAITRAQQATVRPLSPPRTAIGGRNVRRPADEDDFADTDVSSLLV